MGRRNSSTLEQKVMATTIVLPQEKVFVLDKGVIVQLLKAILHLYHEQVESVMGQAGLAAKKMTARLSAALGSRTDSAGRK